MRTKSRRRSTTTILSALCVLALTSGHASANGWGLFERNYIVSPTAYYEVVPSAYIVPTSYVLPTSYVVPTSYTIAPTVYAATSYVVPTTRYYVERPVYATSHHVRTAYALPTTYVYAAPTSVATDPCCVSATPAPVSAPHAATKASAAAAPAKPTPSSVVSEPAEPGMTNQEAETETDDATTKRNTAPPKSVVTSSAVDAAEASPPSAPAPDKSNDTAAPATGTTLTPNPNPAILPAPAPIPPAEKTDDTKKPADESKSAVKIKTPGSPENDASTFPPLPADDADVTRHDAKKPVFDATRGPYKRAGRALNVLEGKVISIDTGRPTEGVQLTISSKSETIADRVTLTDAFGHYAVRLPDGDWTVKVTTEKGRVHSVSKLIVSRGQITDDLGRDIPSLTITR
jgi:hypothetical protein